MKKFLPLSVALIALLLLATCEREWSNPFDPNNTLDPEAWAPQNLQIETTSITERKLTWTYNGPATIQGFKIDRKKGDEAWQVALAALPKETRTWNDTTLIPQTGLTYQYRIYTYAGNNSSANKTTTTQTDFPAPSDLTLTKLTDISYKLEWKDNSTGEQGFKIDRKTGEEDWTIAFATLPESQTTFTDTNVFAVKSEFNLEYRVYAFHGNSATTYISSEISVSLSPPSELQITHNAINIATLNWKSNSDGETGFRVERKYDSSDWTSIAQTKDTVFEDKDFEINQMVFYRVAAYAGNYTSSFIENSFDATIPPPSDLQLEQLSDVSYKLTWTDNSEGEQGFRIDRKTGNNEWKIAFGEVLENSTVFVDENVFTGGKTLAVNYRIYAFYENFESLKISTNTEAELTAPTNLQINQNTITSVNLNWQDNSIGEEGFRIERKQGSGSWQTIASLTGTSYSDETFELNTDVFYRVAAYVGQYQSDYAENSFNSQIPAPTNLQITQNTITSVTLNWEDNNTGGEGYRIERRYSSGTWVQMGTTINNTYSDSDFELNTMVYYRLCAYSGQYSSDFVSGEFSSVIPPPVNFQFNINSFNSITLSWTYSFTGHDGFKIERKVNAGNWELHCNLDPNQTTYMDNQVNLAEDTYEYRIYVFLEGLNSTYVIVAIALPNVTTNDLTNIAYTTATGGGDVTDQGSSPVSARGVCWSNSPSPTLENNLGFTNNGSGIGAFTSSISGLNPAETYYVRAYATNGIGNAYGDDQTFTTLQTELPTVTTAQATNITQNSAVSGGNVISDGGAAVTLRGVCWSTNPNPTTSNQKTINGSGTGNFISNITGLSMGVIYYVRSYAINIVGTAYGSQISFTTANLPTVTTANITNITMNTATGGGNVTADGGSYVTQRGICWSTSPNPTIANHSTNNGSGTGSFSSNLSNLNPNTNYYVRAYATNNVGTAYGNQVIFTTLPWQCGGNFTDPRDNKVYGTVQIGTQCWMNQNLNIGTRINGSNDQTNNGMIEKYCYDNSETNCNTYGGLYQWNEMMQYSTTQSVQGICPSGWHLPTDAEWTALSTYLGGISLAGGKMKETGTTHWKTPNTGATNSSGFTGLPGGSRYSIYLFSSITFSGYFWSSTENSTSAAWRRQLYYDNTFLDRDDNLKSYGFSIRCLRD